MYVSPPDRNLFEAQMLVQGSDYTHAKLGCGTAKERVPLVSQCAGPSCHHVLSTASGQPRWRGRGQDDGTSVGVIPHVQLRSSWADVMHMIHERLPQTVTSWVERLNGEHDGGGASASCALQVVAGFCRGASSGEWAHGWHSSPRLLLPNSTPLPAVMSQQPSSLRSHSGGGGYSHVFHVCPTSQEFTVES